MIFKDNFSELLLISEAPVMFYCEEEYLKQNVFFTIKLINMKDSFIDPYLQNALFFLNLTSKELQTMLQSPEPVSLWQYLCKLGLQHTSMPHRMIKYFLSYVLGEQFVDASDKWLINSIECDETIFNRIGEINLVAAGLKKFDEQSTKIDKPQWLIEKEEEIRRIKKQGKKNTSEHQQFTELSKTLIAINYEFGYTFEQLFNMNYYHIQYLASFVGKAVNYDIQKRQVFSKKKIKYITDK